MGFTGAWAVVWEVSVMSSSSLAVADVAARRWHCPPHHQICKWESDCAENTPQHSQAKSIWHRAMPSARPSSDYWQAATPSIAPSQACSFEIWPASIARFSVSLVIGVGARKIAFISTPFSPPDHFDAPSNRIKCSATGQSGSDFSRSLAKLTRVFPNRNGLGATRHTVESRQDRHPDRRPE